MCGLALIETLKFERASYSRALLIFAVGLLLASFSFAIYGFQRAVFSWVKIDMNSREVIRPFRKRVSVSAIRSVKLSFGAPTAFSGREFLVLVLDGGASLELRELMTMSGSSRLCRFVRALKSLNSDIELGILMQLECFEQGAGQVPPRRALEE